MTESERFEALQELARLEAEAERRAQYKFRRYFPDEGPCRRELYVKHLRFFKAGATFLERLFLAANRIGKCSTAATVVSTPDGNVTLGRLYERGLPFEVWAWDGQRRVRARAGVPFKKSGAHACYRLTMADGQMCEVADEHRLLTPGGWQRLSQLLPRSGAVHLGTSSAVGQSIHDEDGQNWRETLQDWRAHCFLGSRPGDGRLRSDRGVGRSRARSRAGARGRSAASWRAGGSVYRRTSSDLTCAAHLSTQDVVRRRGGLFAASGVRDGNNSLARWIDWCSGVVRLLPALGGRLQSDDAAPRHWPPTTPPPVVPVVRPSASCISENQIVACDSIGVEEVYDFEVAQFHNYIAADLVHHNTDGAAYEVTCHLTGLYPPWWEGRRFAEAGEWWAAGTTAATTRDIIQKALYGPPQNPRTGMVPGHLIVDTTPRPGTPDALGSLAVRHASGAIAPIYFKSFDQGRISFQGTEKQGIWLDEEPPDDVEEECLLRTMTVDGMVIITFTPIEGLTPFVQTYIDTCVMESDTGEFVPAKVEFWKPSPDQA